jgi:hypothetical protein
VCGVCGDTRIIGKCPIGRPKDRNGRVFPTVVNFQPCSRHRGAECATRFSSLDHHVHHASSSHTSVLITDYLFRGWDTSMNVGRV